MKKPSQRYLFLLLFIIFWCRCETSFCQIHGETSDLSQRRWYTLQREKMATVVVNGVTITHGDLEERMRTLRRADYFATQKKYQDMRPGEFRQFVKNLLIRLRTIFLEKVRERRK